MILAWFILIIFSLMDDFGECNRLTTGLRHDLRKVPYKSLDIYGLFKMVFNCL